MSRSSSERPTASRCASGSSSRRTSGSWARQAASAISLRWPPERAFVGSVRSASSSPRSSSVARARPSMLGPPACLPALDELLLAAEDARHLVEVGRELRRGELVGDPVQLAVELVQVGPGRADGLERVPLVAERVLRQERDDDPAAAHGGARVGLLEPGDEPEHRRLAGAVGADDADAGARLDREVQAVEHGSAAERLADGVQADERHGATRCERWRARTRPCRRGAHRRGARRPRSRSAQRAPRRAGRRSGRRRGLRGRDA